MTPANDHDIEDTFRDTANRTIIGALAARTVVLGDPDRMLQWRPEAGTVMSADDRTLRRGLRGRRRHLSLRAAAVISLVSLAIAACQGAGGPTPTPTPTQQSAPATAGLVAPVRAPQMLTVLNGYDNPPPDEPCPTSGYGHDHCGHQEYGLDLVPSDLSDLLVLAPIAGTIRWGLDAVGCLGMSPDVDPMLNLTVCHLSALRASGHVDPGEVLGLRKPTNPWVHLSLNVQYDSTGGQLPVSARTPIPVTGRYAIAGHDFPAQTYPPANRHACETIRSTTVASGDTSLPSPLPAIAQADLSACGSTPSPLRPPSTPTPTPPRASPASSPTSSVAIVEFRTPTSGSGPNAIANGPDGALWFTESIGNRIGRITTSGEITEFVIPTPGSAPIGIVAGPDGAIWFTENGANRIGRITSSGAVTEYRLPHDGNAGPGTIIVGPDGALWFTEQYANRIGRITTAGQVTEWAVPTPNATPWGLTVGPDHNVWFTELDGSKLGRITGSGAITEFALPHAGGRPNDLVSGPDGAFWVTELNGNRITRVTVAGAAQEFPLTGSVGPDTIVVGPDGALWFTEYAAGGLGRITTSGELSQYHIPSGSSSAPSGMVVGPDGNLWFAELGAWLSYRDRIGRATLP